MEISSKTGKIGFIESVMNPFSTGLCFVLLARLFKIFLVLLRDRFSALIDYGKSSVFAKYM